MRRQQGFTDKPDLVRDLLNRQRGVVLHQGENLPVNAIQLAHEPILARLPNYSLILHMKWEIFVTLLEVNCMP